MNQDNQLTLLQRSRHEIPPVVQTPHQLEDMISRIDGGTGPVAVDTERAHGYRYSPRAYLVQIRREGAGTFLIDPIAFTDLRALGEVINNLEWILHAASQDLPSLAELGLVPQEIFDTEVASRLLNLPKVSLGAVSEYFLNIQLEKKFSAVDWSTRPLPEAWLQYAALDVELLIPIADKITAQLREQGKFEWAMQEFAAILAAEPNPVHPEPWRKTSNISKVRGGEKLAVVRSLWQAREKLAAAEDIAPSRIVTDKSIVEVAQDFPPSTDKLRSFIQHRNRKFARLNVWQQAIDSAVGLPKRDLPAPRGPVSNKPPQTRVWAERNPQAFARLSEARAALAEIAETNDVPVENLLTPAHLRELCWGWPFDQGNPKVCDILDELGARPWQIELTAEPLQDIFAAISLGQYGSENNAADSAKD